MEVMLRCAGMGKSSCCVYDLRKTSIGNDGGDTETLPGNVQERGNISISMSRGASRAGESDPKTQLCEGSALKLQLYFETFPQEGTTEVGVMNTIGSNTEYKTE